MEHARSHAQIIEPGNDRRDDLAAAFAFFNETSEQLSTSYRLLERRVEQLSLELDRAAEEKAAVRRSSRRLATRMQALLDFLPGGVVVLDARGRILEANPAACELLKISKEHEHWRDVIKRSFAPRNDDGLEVSTHNGRRISIATSSMGDDGQIILLTDQSETRRLQAEVSRNERLSAMGKMVSALAHQIRTPLSAATLYAGQLRGDRLSSEKREEFSEKLWRRLQHMESQVRDMLLFVKCELPLNDQVPLADLELGLRDAAECVLQTRNAHCQWVNRTPHTRVKCHREALISAMMNLINNSVQASLEKPNLSLYFDTIDSGEGGYAVISVVDRGCGMTDHALKQGQELFATTKSQGTGLGLSVVQSVARAHGGSLTLSSEPERGTMACLWLPLSISPSASLTNSSEFRGVVNDR